MKPKILALLVALVLVAAGWYFSNQDSPVPKGDFAGEVGISAPGNSNKKLSGDLGYPDFFISRHGQVLTLSELRGKYVFINFWNTWCGPCREEMPDLNKLYLEKKDTVEFLFINIATQEKSNRDIIDFIKDNKLELPVYLDTKGQVAGSYGIRSIPTTVVLDPRGVVVYAQPGGLTYNAAKSIIE